jgi:hypothetical protein
VKILFVENHSVFAQQAINHFLSGYQVMVVPSLLMARLQLANNHFDLLLLAYQPVKKEMPSCYRPGLMPFAARWNLIGSKN